MKQHSFGITFSIPVSLAYLNSKNNSTVKIKSIKNKIGNNLWNMDKTDSKLKVDL